MAKFQPSDIQLRMNTLEGNILEEKFATQPFTQPHPRLAMYQKELAQLKADHPKEWEELRTWMNQ